MSNLEDLSGKSSKNIINIDERSNDSSSLIIDDEIVTIETTNSNMISADISNNILAESSQQDPTITSKSNDNHNYDFNNHTQSDYDNFSYKELQRVAMSYDLPGNMKKELLLQVVKERSQGNEAEVQRLLASRRTKRSRNSSAPQRKQPRGLLEQQKCSYTCTYDKMTPTPNPTYTHHEFIDVGQLVDSDIKDVFYQENARSQRQSLARSARSRIRTDSSGSSDPQWLPPSRYRKSNDNKTYYGIAQSPTLLDSSSASLSDLLSQSSRGTTPTLVNKSPSTNMSPMMGNLRPPPAYPGLNNRSQHQQIMAQHQQVLAQQQQQQIVAQQQQQQQIVTQQQIVAQQQQQAFAQQQQQQAFAQQQHQAFAQQQQQAFAQQQQTVTTANSQLFMKKATKWRDEYMRQQTINQQTSYNNTGNTSRFGAAHSSQGEAVEGSAFRYQPYQRPQMPPLQKEVRKQPPPPLQPPPLQPPPLQLPPLPPPPPPGYLQQPHAPPPSYPSYPYLHHNNTLPHLNSSESQLCMQYLMNKNPGVNCNNDMLLPQQHQFQTGQNQRMNSKFHQEQQPIFPMLTQLLHKTQTTSRHSQPSSTVTSETSIDTTTSSTSSTNEVEITAEIKLTAKEGRPTKLIDMRNYPGNSLWEKFDLSRKNVNLLNDSTWMGNSTSNNGTSNSIIPLQTSVLTATHPISPVPDTLISNVPSQSHEIPLQNSLVSHANSIVPTPTMTNNASFLDVPSTSKTVPNSCEITSDNIVGNSSSMDTSSTWLSNYNWLPNPPQYNELPKTLNPIESNDDGVDGAKEAEKNEEYENNNTEGYTYDLNIPDDIDEQYNAALSASWSDVNIIDENFLKSILSPTSVSCKNHLNGCFESFISKTQLANHESECMLRNVRCLVPPCPWIGVVSALAHHLTQVHGNKIIQGRKHSHIIQLKDLCTKGIIRFLQFAEDRLFVVEVHYKGQVVYAACQWIPDPELVKTSELLPLGSLEIVGIHDERNIWHGMLQKYPSPFKIPSGFTGKHKCLCEALPWSYHAKLSFVLLHVNISFMPEHLVRPPGTKAPANSPVSRTTSPKISEISEFTTENVPS